MEFSVVPFKHLQRSSRPHKPDIDPVERLMREADQITQQTEEWFSSENAAKAKRLREEMEFLKQRGWESQTRIRCNQLQGLRTLDEQARDAVERSRQEEEERQKVESLMHAARDVEYKPSLFAHVEPWQNVVDASPRTNWLLFDAGEWHKPISSEALRVMMGIEAIAAEINVVFDGWIIAEEILRPDIIPDQPGRKGLRGRLVQFIGNPILCAKLGRTLIEAYRWQQA